MKPKTIIAIILIALGITTFAYQDITYTAREKVSDLSPIQMTSETTKTLPLPPPDRGSDRGLVGSIVLMVMGGKKS